MAFHYIDCPYTSPQLEWFWNILLYDVKRGSIL